MVLSGTEQLTAQALGDLSGVRAFAPVYSAWRRLPKHRRAKLRASHERVEYPLFRGYVFLLLETESAISSVYATKDVIGAVQTMHGLSYIKDDEIQELMRRHMSGEFNDQRKLELWVRNPETVPVVRLVDDTEATYTVLNGSFEGLKALVA